MIYILLNTIWFNFFFANKALILKFLFIKIYRNSDDEFHCIRNSVSAFMKSFITVFEFEIKLNLEHLI